MAALDPCSLLGTWQLNRLIEDHLADEESRIRGTLELSAVADHRIRWEERGHWQRPAGVIAVRRGLWLVRETDGWWALFEDERPFHPWRPGTEVVHPCSLDTYRGRFEGTTEQWTITWEVTGPGKDYRMSTLLTR